MPRAGVIAAAGSGGPWGGRRIGGTNVAPGSPFFFNQPARQSAGGTYDGNNFTPAVTRNYRVIVSFVGGAGGIFAIGPAPLVAIPEVSPGVYRLATTLALTAGAGVRVFNNGTGFGTTITSGTCNWYRA